MSGTTKDKASECVKVAVRCRPINSKEKDRGCQVIVDVDTGYSQILLKKPASGEVPRTFTYDHVYGADST